MTVWLMIIISEQNRLTDSECSINQSIMGRRLTATLIQEGWMFLILTHLHIIYLDHTKCQMWRFSNLTFLNLKHTRSPRGEYKFKKAPRGVRTPFFFKQQKQTPRARVVRRGEVCKWQQPTTNNRTKLYDNHNHIHIKLKVTNGRGIGHSVTTSNCFDNSQRIHQITDYKQKKKLNVCDIETDVDEKCSQ